jgi:hypothetical protein
MEQHYYMQAVLPVLPPLAVFSQPVCRGRIRTVYSLALADKSLAHIAAPYRGRQDARLQPKYIQ